MKRIDMTNVQEAGEFPKLTPGGYVCRYTNVEDKPDKEYLYMEFDIAEGEFKDYYKQMNENLKFWGGRLFRSYKEKAQPMFKRMCSAVTKSNPGFLFDGNTNADEKTLVGKLVGIVLGEEEYVGNDGSVKTRLYVSTEKSVDDIRSGNYKVPALKKLADASPTASTTADTGFMNVPDGAEEVPFN